MHVVLLAIALTSAVTGCSLFQALGAPPPVEYRHVKIGESRSETIGHLGMPSSSQKTDGMIVDRFEFTDGYNPAWKARVIIYAVGDGLTCCLAEAIFWPIELKIMNGRQCRATVEYDQDQRVMNYLVESRGGKRLWDSQQAAPPETATESPQPAAPAP